MLNTIDTIALHWPAAALTLSEDAYTAFLNHEDMYIESRLKKWVGEEAYEDAKKSMPANPLRANCLKEAEMNLFHVSCLEKLWRDCSMGKEKSVTLPSGMSVSLTNLTETEYKALIQQYLDEAYRACEEYICL
ncbi:MAG: hypothetical protein Kow00102_05750 [Spirochaetota bacterium]|nr:hypothetical protein [Spirochaetota bacterium]